MHTNKYLILLPFLCCEQEKNCYVDFICSESWFMLASFINLVWRSTLFFKNKLWLRQEPRNPIDYFLKFCFILSRPWFICFIHCSKFFSTKEIFLRCLLDFKDSCCQCLLLTPCMHVYLPIIPSYTYYCFSMAVSGMFCKTFYILGNILHLKCRLFSSILKCPFTGLAKWHGCQ